MRCPRCLKEYPRLLALSRADNKTYICDACGVAEALEDYIINERKRKEARRNGNA